MCYIVRNSVLREENSGEIGAVIRNSWLRGDRKILSPEGTLMMEARIRTREKDGTNLHPLQRREYLLYDAEGNLVASAQPGLGERRGPFFSGPYADHAHMRYEGKSYRLALGNGRDYRLEDGAGNELVSFSHRGLAGGWRVEAAETLPVRLLCGSFVFAQYMEEENAV